jgi:acyl-homoserine-lactone acylase
MSVQLLMSAPKLSFEDFVRLKLTTRSLLADRILPELVAAAAASGDEETRQAAALLRAWDHEDNADSRGALLFETWAAKFCGPKFDDFSHFAVPWSAQLPVETPSGLKDPAAAVALLKEAIAETKAKYGSIDRPFGEVSRFHIDDVDLPGNGGFGSTGIFRTITWSEMKAGERTPVHGETWVSMVEFSTPLKAEGLMSYGNSSQPGSKHRSDQLAALAQRKLRTLWVERAQVEQHVEDKTSY